MKGTPWDKFKAAFERANKKMAKDLPAPRIFAAKGG
jgi:hypothetical protein